MKTDGFLQKLQKLVACIQSVTTRELSHSWFQFVTIASKTITQLNKPLDMKRMPTMKNNEKIWKLEYWEPVPQEPDEQNKIKDDEIQDEST